MTIENSVVSMSSARSYSQQTGVVSTSVNRLGAREKSPDFFRNYLREPMNKTAVTGQAGLSPAESIRAIRLQLLHHIFDFLRSFCMTGYGASGVGTSADHGSSGTEGSSAVTDYGNNYPEQQFSSSPMYGMSGRNTGNPLASQTLLGGSLWTRTSTSYFYHEQEETTFESTGMVRTADGRSIEFGVSLSMSRSFTEVYEQIVDRQFFLTDPLIINLDTGITSVSDQKFLFDLDCDGESESISFAGAGSGFLALDANGDGIINDGSELFGTRSGDGFADLARYDSDGNGWIDEADDIYRQLKVWVRDEDGTDRLMDLKEADVGAIYLGRAATQFSLNDMMNNPNAYIRSTGIFLHESGRTGTIAQVDMVS